MCLLSNLKTRSIDSGFLTYPIPVLLEWRSKTKSMDWRKTKLDLTMNCLNRYFENRSLFPRKD